MNTTFWTMLRKNLMIVAAMSILMALLCGIIERNETERLRNDIIRGTRDGLEQFEAQLTSVQSAYSRVFDREDIGALMLMNGPLEPFDYYRIKKSQEYVSSIAFANAYVLDMFLYVRDPHILLTKYASFLSMEDFELYYHLDAQNRIRPLLSEKQQISPGFIKSSFQSIHDARSVSTLLHYFSASASTGSNNLVVFAVYDAKRVIQLILPIELPEGSTLLLTDAEGQPLIEKDADSTGGTDSAFCVQTRLFSLSLTLPSAWIRRQSGSLSTLSILFAALASLLGVLMSVLAAMRQARPVKQLLLEDAEKSRRSKEELSFVRDEILRMNQQQKSVINQLENTRTALVHNMLERLLFSKDLGERDLREISEYIGEFPACCCVCFGKIVGDTTTARAAFMHAIRIRRPQGTIFHQLDTEGFALIWGLKEGQTQANAAQEAQKMLLDLQFGAESPIRMVVSLPTVGLENIAAAFSQARRAYFARERWENVCVLCAQPSETTAISQHDFSALYRALISGDAQQSRTLLTHIYAEADLDSESLYYTLQTTLVLAARDGLKQHTLQPPAYSRGLNGQLGALLRKAEEITACVNEEKKSHNHALKQDILIYIHEHFADSDLYGASLAEKFHVSEKYLYNFIKEQTGSSLGELVMSLRLERAAEWLRAGSMPVGKIGNQIGFASQNTFYKAFKRHFGLSPTEYRQRETEKCLKTEGDIR